MNSDPVIKKNFFKLNSIFETQHIIFDPINPLSREDAELILNLRSRQSGNFLRQTSGGINEQLEYLQSYGVRNKLHQEIYFKLKDKQKDSFNGVVRLTNLNDEETFNWESLVFDENCTPIAPIDVMITIYKIGFEILKRKKCGPWDVDKRHERMMKIHEFCKMYSIDSEDKQYFHISVSMESYFANINRFNKLGLGRINWI